MKRQRLVFAVALILIVAGQLITRFAAPETHIFGNVLRFLGAIGGVIGFSMKPTNR